ncbi:hypothetical protein GGR57DRAFT_492144 [Xylariaceae sp. FL1272]|nr:hypothetical protein GGR57DRAFT_492144 [Xylariaceae sp. FL1272]
MKFSSILSGLALAGAAIAAPKGGSKKLQTTKIAGVEVVYTDIVQAAFKQIEVFKTYQPYLYNHAVRTWLFGAAGLNNNATLKAEVDLELHAVGSMLHDLGWDIRPNSPWVTEEYTFEVDSARFAVQWVKDWCTKNNRKQWTAERLEKLYDGIMLQTFIGAPEFKNIDTKWIVQSITFEFPIGESPLIQKHDYDNVWAAYSNATFFRGTNFTFTNWAVQKPEPTTKTFIRDFGAAYVQGYNESLVGQRLFDLINGGLALELYQYGSVPYVQKLPAGWDGATPFDAAAA